MLSRILGAVVSVVLIAASGVGGYLGMTTVVDKVEAGIAPTADPSAGLDYLVSNGTFSLALPLPFTSEFDQAGLEGSMLTTTTWHTDPAAEFYGVVSADLLGAQVDPQILLHAWLAGVAESGGRLTEEEEFVLGTDPARRAVVIDSDGYGYLTAVIHGTTALLVIGVGPDNAKPSRYDEVVASLQWYI